MDDDPRCSNPRWDLFKNNGYFCCRGGDTGYNANKTDTNGCLAAKDDLKDDQVRLEIVSKGHGEPAFTPTSLALRVVVYSMLTHKSSSPARRAYAL